MTTTKTDKSMAALAEILRQDGIRVTQVLDGGNPLLPQPLLVVRGDDDEIGFRAAAIALEFGFPLHRLDCSYDIRLNQVIRESRHWVLRFILRSLPE